MSGPPNYITRAGPTQYIKPEDINVSYTGTRETSQGETVTATLAQRALRLFYAGDPLPIYKDYEGIPTELGYNNLSKRYGPGFEGFITDPDNDPDAWYLILPTEGEKRPEIRDEIKEAAASPDITDRPIIMLVTSGMPHAIIYIFHEAKLYTCGYGYDDNESEYRNFTSEILTKSGMTDIAQIFKELRGAIYTADKLAPQENHEAKISWVGFLDTGMVNRIQDFLNNTLYIIFNGRKEGRYNKVSNTSKLLVSKSYYAPAYITRENEAYNCLTWAQKILGINIDCGLIGAPSSCISITEAQFELLKSNMNNRNLPQIIEQIQKTLVAPPNICTRIGRAMGMCGGSRKRKRKGKGKGRSRKAKKTNKKRKYNK